ncbi:DUF3987 domain-containing protein [Scytonema sp. PRP1]|uniref:DUF3987 domain-containing protein n=1 Tax=Scytonema sp. PRP1 TaxID=3120513 RepID=UPI00300CC4C9
MHSEETSGQLVVVCGQLAQQLALLGYQKGDTVYIRAFYHKDDPRKAADGGKKAEARSLNELIEIIQNWQAEGRGVYLVVNGGGQRDKDVTQCRAIFYEHDKLDKEISRELWRRLELPEPTFQIDTGGKSIHSYWVFDQPIEPVSWKALQTDLLEYANADRALKNPSRVMRLAGAYHISPSGTHLSTIIAASGNRYNFDLLRAIVPVKQVTPVSVQDTRSNTLPSISPLTVDEKIPLQECLTLEQRHLIANGAPDGRRNDTGAAIARNLIGTSVRLQYLGENYSGEPRQLFDNYCARCSPPLDSKEADQIWKSAEKDNPSPTLTDDVILNCIKSWRRRQQTLTSKTNNTNQSSNNVAQIKLPVEVSLTERIREILSRGLKSFEEKAALLELAKQTGTQSKDIEGIAKLLRQDLEQEEGREERKAEITELLTGDNNSIDLANFLPKPLADPLKLWCGWLNIPESVALTAVLTTVSTLHPVGTELVIHRAMDFSVPPILFSAVVGESGQKKSPVYRTLIKKPLRLLQNEAKDNYLRQLTQYEQDLAEWEQSAGEDPKPTKPGLPVYFFTDATGEGIKTQAQETPTKAMFALIDELAGLFNSANQYRGGKGSDRQDMLSYYDGLGQTVLRAGGIKVDVERIYVSIFGGIQPEVLKEHTKDLKDSDGHWARFLFAIQPLAASTLPDDDTDINLNELLSGCYRRIASLPLCQYKLSREAFKRYQTVYNDLEQKRVNHPQPGMRAVYSKMEGAIGRLALNLHVLEMSFNGSAVANAFNEISLKTMNQAIALAEFYTCQIKTLHAESKADKGELSALLAKILEFATEKGSITPRDAALKFYALRSSQKALEHFRELEAMGYGKVEKQKRNWVFTPIIFWRDGLKTLSSNSLGSSRDESTFLRDDSRDGFFKEKSLSNNTLGSSRDERDERDEFPEKTNSSFVNLDKQDLEKNQKTSRPSHHHANVIVEGQELTEPASQPRDDSRDGLTFLRDDQCVNQNAVENSKPVDSADTSLKPLGFSLKAGERIKCYPSERHFENKWEVSATITELETERGWFVGCSIQYQNKSRQTLTTRISGGRADWILKKID